MKNIILYYFKQRHFIIIIISLIISNIYSQDKEKLKNLQNKAKEDIEYANKILSETREKKKYSIDELKVLDYKIDARNKYIKELSKSIYIHNQKNATNKII